MLRYSTDKPDLRIALGVDVVAELARGSALGDVFGTA